MRNSPEVLQQAKNTFQARVLEKCAEKASARKDQRFEEVVIEAAGYALSGGLDAVMNFIRSRPEYHSARSIYARKYMQVAIKVHEQESASLTAVFDAHKQGISAGRIMRTNVEVFQDTLARMKRYVDGRAEYGDIVDIATSSGELTFFEYACRMHHFWNQVFDRKQTVIDKLSVISMQHLTHS